MIRIIYHLIKRFLFLNDLFLTQSMTFHFIWSFRSLIVSIFLLNCRILHFFRSHSWIHNFIYRGWIIVLWILFIWSLAQIWHLGSIAVTDHHFQTGIWIRILFLGTQWRLAVLCMNFCLFYNYLSRRTLQLIIGFLNWTCRCLDFILLCLRLIGSRIFNLRLT